MFSVRSAYQYKENLLLFINCSTQISGQILNSVNKMSGRFKYTHENSKFTTEQKQFYEDHGYILIKNNVDHKLLDEMRQRFVTICSDLNGPHGVAIIMKDKSLKVKGGVSGEFLINKMQDFVEDEVFWKYCSNKIVVDVIENIIGPNITAVHTMFINKPPDAHPESSLHPLHQDLYYFPFRPADNIAASWTALEHIDEKNGCLHVVPGSHKGELLKHGYPKGFQNKLYHGVQGLDHLPKVNVVMEKGDTVFFHPILLHGSGPNFTKGFRKAISCHYADSNCHFIDVRGTIQETIAEEIEEVTKKMGANISFNDIWRAKSRLVRGTPGNFQRYDSHL